MSEPVVHKAISSEPRERHYVMAHYAFRQICEQDSHYFFSLMASPEKDRFLENLIQQVEGNCPDDTTSLKPDEFKVVLSRVANHPMVLIEMPPAQAYIEAAYIAVVAMVDMTQPMDEQEAGVQYFTLELGEGEGADAYFFCQWQDEDHLNLAEMETLCSLDEFGLVVENRVTQSQSK